MSDKPYNLPNNIDLFTWSLPFLADKSTLMLKNILAQCSEEKQGKDFLLDKEGVVKSKIKAVARLSKMYSNLKDNCELILELKGMVPDGKIPKGIILEGRPAIKDAIREFANAKVKDMANERWPDSPNK